MYGLEDFERLALPHMDAAYNLALWLVKSRADAEDIVQDAYLRAFRAFGTLTGDDVRPWLLTIVRNVAYRWLSNRSRGANVISLEGAVSGRDDGSAPVFEIPADEPSAEALLIGKGEQALVLAALAQLPPAFREVVVLRELEGLSYQEISRVAGIPVGTVMSRLSRGREQLREQLTALIATEDKNAL